MTSREKSIAGVLLAVVGVGGVAGLGYGFYSQLESRNGSIRLLTKQIEDTEIKVKKVTDEKPQLDHWRRLSMLNDLKARDKYKEELMNLMRKNGVLVESFPQAGVDGKSTIVHPTKPGKQSIYTSVNYQVRARAKMQNLVDFMKDFQTMPRMHRIKTLTIERSDNSAKKEAEYMTVQIGIEALVILDAEIAQKNFVKRENAVMAAEAIAALRRAPVGIPVLAWYVSPIGANPAPLNPPSKTRTYSDIARRNFFIGPVKEAPTGPTKNPDDEKIEPRISEEFLNLMRYSHFIGLTDDGRVEAKLWDRLNNSRKRIKASGGFNKIPMVQTARNKELISGIVSKIEDREILFRVTLNATDARDAKWWRYPDDGKFYKLDKEDLATLITNKRLKEEDKDQVYLIGAEGWDELVKAKAVKVSKDGKKFTTNTDSLQCDIVFSDRDVFIVKMPGWPLKGVPSSASVAVWRIYPEQENFYRIQKNHLASLVAAGKVKAEEGDRILVVHNDYWDWLRKDYLVKTDNGGKTFAFYGDLVKGDVISRGDEVLVLRVAEKYCKAPGNEEAGTKTRWHEGYCVLHIGRSVEEALMTPLSEAKTKELLKPATPVSSN